MVYRLIIFSFLLVGSLFALNVRDFGAIGDGVADDTDAIQRAIDQAERQESKVLVGRLEFPPWDGHGGHGSSGEVFLPAGTYRLSRPLVYDFHHGIIRGEAGTTLLSAPGTDLLYLHGVNRISIENIRFEGGRIQLNIYTDNNDMTMIRVEGCQFLHAEQESIRAFNTRATEWRGIPPYLVKRQPGVLPRLQENPEYDASPAMLPNSTIFTFCDCAFQGSCTFLRGESDQFNVEGCTFERVGGTAPIFHLRGHTNMRRVHGTYRKSGADGPAVWMAREPFDNRETILMGSEVVCLEECEFLCEEGASLSFLRTTSKPNYASAIIRILDSRFNLSGAPILTFAPGSLVNILEFRGNRNLDRTPTSVAVFDKPPTREELDQEIRFQAFPAYMPKEDVQKDPRFHSFADIPLENHFHFLVGDNDGFQEELPSVLQKFRCQVPTQELLEATYVKALHPAAWPKETDYAGKTILPDFGSAQSDTQAIQNACDQALPGDRVILPGRRIEIQETIRVSAGVEVTAEGTALLVPVQGHEQSLQVLLRFLGEADRTLCRNIAFAFGQVAVEIPAGKGVFAFQNCLFLGQHNTGVLAMNTPEAVLLTDCLYYAYGGLRTNARHSEIRRSWVCNHPLMENRGFFENYGGEMVAEFNLAVPILPRMDIGAYWENPAHKYLNCENNLRWFDNHGGKLFLDGNRLGGEFGGMTPVYLFGNNATLRLQGGYNWFGNFNTRRCAVYCHDAPKAVLLKGVIFNPESWLGPGVPYNVMGRNPDTDQDIPKYTTPQIQGTALMFYR